MERSVFQFSVSRSIAVTTHHPLSDHRLQESFDVIHKAFVGASPSSKNSSSIPRRSSKMRRHGNATRNSRLNKLKTPDAQTVALGSPRTFPEFPEEPSFGKSGSHAGQALGGPIAQNWQRDPTNLPLTFPRQPSELFAVGNKLLDKSK